MYERAECAVIGTGQYGTAVVTQQFSVRGIRVRIVADIDAKKAQNAYLAAGLPEKEIAYAADEKAAAALLKTGKYVYTDDANAVFAAHPDVLCDCTGNPEASARIALAALDRGVNLVAVGKEADSAVGAILRKKFAEKGLVYTAADGDQHGLLIQLVKWARASGLTVIAAGKSRDGELVWNEAAHTVRLWDFTADVTGREEVLRPLAGNAAKGLAARKAALAPLPSAGGYDYCELAIAANGTGLSPACPELVQAPLRISEIASVYCKREHGGILERGGIIDMVQCLRREDDFGMGGGVYVVVRAENGYSQSILADKGPSNADHSACLLFRPYHLCGVETPNTLIRAARGLDGTDGLIFGLECEMPPYRQAWDVVRTAKRDIAAGEIFAGDHGDMFDTLILPARTRGPLAPVPAHMLTGNAAAKTIRKGELITYEHVTPPDDSLLWALREEQEKDCDRT